MKPTLISSLFEALKPILEQEGFKFVASRREFVRRSCDRSERFHITVLNDRPGHRLRPSASVRFENVERIFHRTSGFAPKYQSATPTVGVDFDNLYGMSEFQVRILNESDLAAAVERVVAIFREYAVPYFARFPDIEAVDAVINEHPHNNCADRGGPTVFRYSIGMIVAKLVGRKHFDELAEIYYKSAQNDNAGFYLPQFKSLLKDLKGDM